MINSAKDNIFYKKQKEAKIKMAEKLYLVSITQKAIPSVFCAKGQNCVIGAKGHNFGRFVKMYTT